MNTRELVLIAALGAAVPAVSFAEETHHKSSAGQYIGDAALTAKVKTALLTEKNLKSLDVNVETLNGVVQLSGFVVSSAQIDQAVDIARHVKGVRDVKNDLRLKTDTAA